MRIRHILLTIIAAAFTFATAQDAEIHDEIKGDLQRYKDVFPPEVKTIAMIAPASYPGSRFHKRGVELIKAAGYKVKIGKHAFDKPEKGKPSAPLEARLEDFYNAWNDDEVDMILCIRGGQGSLDLLNSLDFSKLKPRENLRLQGYSDITFILSAMQSKKIGHPVAGPMSGSISGLGPDCIEEMRKMHNGLTIGPVPVKPIIPGDCSGLPLAGLLQRFSVVCKTQFRPETKGRIIIIEAVSLKIEQVKQSFDTLIAEGFFNDCAGVVFGHFIRSGSQEEVNAILDDVAKRINKPTYKGFPFGHSSNCYTIDFSRPFVIKNNQVTIPGK